MNGPDAITVAPKELPSDRPTKAPPARSRPISFANVAIGIPLLLVVGGLGYVAWAAPERFAALWQRVAGTSPRTAQSPGPSPSDPAPPPWDGRTIVLTEEGKRGLGLVTAKVEAQTRPIQVEVVGTTKYDEDSLSRIRPMFKARVDKVWRTVGQTVKHGDPLIELYSKELAEAKSICEIEKIQWIYELNLLAARRELIKTNAISAQIFLESQNNEMKSRREYEVARDKLLVFGLSDGEVDAIDREVGTQKAKMTLRSPSDGIVIERDVAPGNLYDENDNLLVIAPMDHLWVWGNVFESDQDLVRLGQDWEIQFPFLDRSLPGKVEYISNRVDPSTHAVRIRTSIKNPDGRLKSDMLVRGILSIPRIPGRVVVPRTALIVSGGKYFVFVRTSEHPDTFVRREVNVVQEKHDLAVLEAMLEPGQEVIAVGGLVVNQIHEENELASSGMARASGHQN